MSRRRFPIFNKDFTFKSGEKYSSLKKRNDTLEKNSISIIIRRADEINCSIFSQIAINTFFIVITRKKIGMSCSA